MTTIMFVALGVLAGLAVILDDGRFTGHRW